MPIFIARSKLKFMKTDIYDNIRKIRMLKNISQDEMAEHLGVSQSSYGKLERSQTKITMSRLEELAGIFEMTSFEIVNFDPTTMAVFRTPEVVVKPEPVAHLPEEDSQEAAVLRARLHYLEETNKVLKRQLADKEEIISMLRE
jgi:transcriptional regulator with XRE-family HTH domain